MNIYEALAEVKTLNGRLEQLAEFWKSSNTYDADTDPDFEFEDLSRQIDETLGKITGLKLAIQATNLANIVRVGDEDMQLARAILELSNVRTKLSHVSAMQKVDRDGLFGRERRSSEEAPRMWQKSRAELLKLQAELEKRKNALDSALQEANNRLAVSV